MNVMKAAVDAAYERGRREERADVIKYLKGHSEAVGAGPLMVDYLQSTHVREVATLLENSAHISNN